RELDNYFRIGSTYSSNALEGNSLSLNETKILIEDGITVGGKPIRDCYEATGHAKAYDFMLTAARRDESMNVTEELIKRLHYLF
ncbi:MAG: Fic family protein, partial [Oscillospiraceae bacterium]